MTALFWVSAILLIYPLFIYPLILALPRGRRRAVATAERAEPPFVSMLLSVFNEKDVIERKINNFLALNYPVDRLELLIVSDGSYDGTDEIAKDFTSERIRLLRQKDRKGKTGALNRMAEEARGEILLFTDANSMLQDDCLRKLAAPFADPNVGLVSGRSVYLGADGRETTGSLYRRYEEWLKKKEGERWGIIGADGAAYAMRKDLYNELPPEIINDLAHPVQITLAGKKALAEPMALVYEPAKEDGAEFARQTRIMAQSWLVFFRYARALAKQKRFGFLWQFLSHKVLRWLALPLLLLFTVCALALPGAVAGFGMTGTIALFVLACCGGKIGTAGRICRLFMIQGAAGVYGLRRLWRGDLFVIWNPRSE